MCVCDLTVKRRKKKAHEYSDIVFASFLWPGSWGDENWRRESSVTHTGENKRAGTEVKQRILSDGLNRKTYHNMSQLEFFTV